MAEATDLQMQSFADQRIRVFAEAIRAIYIKAKDHKLSIDDEYARAIGSNRWDDARSDGPPHLLQSGNSASPDDFTNFNTWISEFITIIEGTNTGADATNAAALRDNWNVLQRACVRAIE